jgi:2-hydroxymuconate-semialdehyde hydrolase
MTENPEIGSQTTINGIKTNYHDIGEGRAVFFIHGSGPGVSS